MTLSELFKSVPDFRRKQGLRIDLENALWIIFLGISSGYGGYRGIHSFGIANEAFFIKELGLKHGIPSHVTTREILRNLDKKSVIACFSEWANNQELRQGDWLSGDGKALRSTLKNAQNSQQDFSGIVSLFCQRSGLSYAIGEYSNKKDNEVSILHLLLPLLRDKGVYLTLDALYTQKKR